MSTNDPNNTSGLPSYGSTPPPEGGYPPGGGYPPQAPGGYGQPAKNNTKAIISLVLGIVGLLCCGLLAGIPAVILGQIAKKEIAESHGTQTGGGLATAGFILGIIAIVWSLIYGVLIATGVIDAGFNFETS